MAADLDRDLGELLAERARLEAESLPHPKFAAAVQQQMAGARMDYMAKCAEFIFTHGTALAALRAEAGAVDVPSSDYQRGFRDGYERRHLEVLGALV